MPSKVNGEERVREQKKGRLQHEYLKDLGYITSEAKEAVEKTYKKLGRMLLAMNRKLQ